MHVGRSTYASHLDLKLMIGAARTLFVLALLPATTLGLAKEPLSRRAGLSQFAKTVVAAVLPVTAFQEEARAACVPGDVSEECIGVYKLPVKGATETPQSVLAAKDQLLAQRAAADDIREVVAAGRLPEAGMKVLNLIPKVTTAGMAIQQEMQSTYPASDSGVNQMKVLKYQQQYQETVALWSGVDVEIGQALRGQLGASAVAQLSILSSLKEATASFDDFLKLVDSSAP